MARLWRSHVADRSCRRRGMDFFIDPDSYWRPALRSMGRKTDGDAAFFMAGRRGGPVRTGCRQPDRNADRCEREPRFCRLERMGGVFPFSFLVHGDVVYKLYGRVYNCRKSCRQLYFRRENDAMTETFEELSGIIKKRRSIRQYNDKPVDVELVKNIIDVASHAPSNHNRQGWRFFIVADKKVIGKMNDAVVDHLDGIDCKSKVIAEALNSYRSNFTWFKYAPLVVVCCFVKPNRFTFKVIKTDEENNHFTGELISLSMAMQNILLASESLGIGTLVMTAPLVAAREIKAILKIPGKLSIGAFICMGHYEEQPKAPPHLPLDRIIRVISGDDIER